MLVSVLLTCYNGARWIDETIRSVLDQSYPELELIVVNDGSTDRSREIVLGFGDRRLSYLEQANRGIPAARNRGLALARGDAVCLLDQDDLWEADKLALQVGCLVRHPEVGVVYANAEHIDEAGRSLDVRFRPPQPEGWLLDHFLTRGVAVPIMTTMIRRACLERVGGFNERLYGSDDYELLVRIAAEFRFAYLPVRLARLRYHAANAWRDERMFLDRFVIADELAQRFPHRSRLIRRYQASAHYAYGLHLSAKAAGSHARQEFGRAIKASPGYWRAYARWLETLLPGRGDGHERGA